MECDNEEKLQNVRLVGVPQSATLARECLTILRSCAAQPTEMHADFPSEFHFVPQIFLAHLVSVYRGDHDRLGKLLKEKGSQSLQIWDDFNQKHAEIAAETSMELKDMLEKGLCEMFLHRFAEMIKGYVCLPTITDEQRCAELRAEGKCIGIASGSQNNCLIHSLLQLLVHDLCLLPAQTLQDEHKCEQLCQKCRQALVQKPVGHPLRLVF